MFLTRLISGIVLLIITIIACAFGNVFLLGILGIVSLIAYRELTKAIGCGREKDVNALEIVGMTGVCLYYLTMWIWYDDEVGCNPLYLFIIITLVFLAEMAVYVVRFPKYKAEQVLGSFFAFIYAPVMLSFVYLTREMDMGIYLVWLIIISAWGCDTCAYAVGKLMGRKKIFPVLSPKKSLEGCIGGVLGAALIGGIYAYLFVEPAFPEKNLKWAVAVICAGGAVLGIIGDLAASAVKRDHGIKDYGRLIPGHGGIMDRFDSIIYTAPVTYILAILTFR